jgi:hypothetical protein
LITQQGITVLLPLFTMQCYEEIDEICQSSLTHFKWISMQWTLCERQLLVKMRHKHSGIEKGKQRFLNQALDCIN